MQNTKASGTEKKASALKKLDEAKKLGGDKKKTFAEALKKLG